MRAILHPPSSSSSNTTEDNDARVVAPLPSTLPRYQRTPGNDDERHHGPPASPPLLVSPAPASIPSHSSSVALLLVLSAVTWHWGSSSGSSSSLSLSLAGDDVVVGMLAVTREGGQWLSSGDVAVIRVVLGVERGGDVAVVAVEMGRWSWQRRRRVVAGDVAVLGRVGVDELAPGWPKCGR